MSKLGNVAMCAMYLATLAITPAVQGQQRQVNGSGATLFVDFFRDQRHANEVVDWDMDGTVIIDIDMNGIPDDRDDMARNTPNPGFLNSAFLIFQYRSVGSVEGLVEFVTYQCTGDIPESVPSERGQINRLDFAVQGNVTWGGNPPSCTDDTDGDSIPNASGTPLCPQSIDFANVDVPTALATVGTNGAANWSKLPSQAGYGRNTALSGGDPDYQQTGHDNLLASLECLNTNTGAPNINTVYDSTVSWSPICFIANRGTALDVNCDGVEDGAVRMSDLQHLFVTGRLSSGQNLAGATRDVGSGTRNGAMNSINVDPSWGVGDHVGRRINQSVPSPQFTPPRAWTRLGPAHQVNNCGGSGIMEDSVQMRRLGLGYTGVAGSSRAIQDAVAGRYEILSIVKNVDTDNDGIVGSVANPSHWVRPTLDTVLHNLDERTGWQIGGLQTFVTRGHPLGTNIDVDNNGTIDFPATLGGVTAMSNDNAAMYIRNLLTSISNFDANPSGPDNSRTPADFLARNFFLVAAVDAVPPSNAPSTFVANPDLVAAVQTFTTGNSFFNTNPTPPYGDDDNGTTRTAGLVPIRLPNPDFDGDGNVDPYTDGSTNGDYVYRSGGSLFTIAGGNNRLSRRNRVSGDFNNDGRRNLNDVADMMEAYQDPINFEGGVSHGGHAGSQVADVVIVHVIGDFNGDGNFDKEDVRYFADGLAVNPATCNLDRRAAFEAVDLAWQTLTGDNNFFDTVWADGRPYTPGDSALDVAGAPFVSAGAAPVGHDFTIDGDDLAYVQAQIAAGDLNSDGNATWATLDEAARFDLSADVTGDLIVNGDDEAAYGLGCEPCDTNCDGSVNGFDIQPFVEILSGGGSECSPCSADTNDDGSINGFDIQGFVECLGG